MRKILPPSSVVSKPFRLSTKEGATLHCDRDRPASEVRGRCIILPPFGLSKLDLLAPVYYLLCNGFEVVRFDPTCHVGLSEGEIGDFTLGRLTSDVGAVIDAEADEGTAVIGISLSARAAFRLVSEQALTGLILMAPVVNMRQTLIEVCGEDLVGWYLEGTAPESYSILGLNVKRSFCEDCVSGDFSDLGGTLRDGARIRAPTHIIVGTQDRWVDSEEVERVAAAIPFARVTRLTGANHQMFRSPVIFQAYMQAMLRELFALYGLHGEPVIPDFSDVVTFVSYMAGARLIEQSSSAAGAP